MKTILSKEAGGYDLYRIDEDGKRVTFASTQDYKQKLSLKNCEVIERGYDLDELAREITDKEHLLATQYSKGFEKGIIVGFKKALEILGDKKFSEEQMKRIYEKGYSSGRSELNSRESDKIKYDYIQSLQQTEWEVEILEVEDGEVYSVSENMKVSHDKTFDGVLFKHDADGNLILKRK